MVSGVHWEECCQQLERDHGSALLSTAGTRLGCSVLGSPGQDSPVLCRAVKVTKRPDHLSDKEMQREEEVK